jgi:hypothetical protein
MTLAQDFEDFIKVLNQYQVDYMVVGGYALAFHGKPRHTGDLDIWINNTDDNELFKLLLISYCKIGLISFIVLSSIFCSTYREVQELKAQYFN